MEENLDFSHMCDNLLVIRKSNYVRSSACDTQLAVHSTTVVWYPLMLVSAGSTVGVSSATGSYCGQVNKWHFFTGIGLIDCSR